MLPTSIELLEAAKRVDGYYRIPSQRTSFYVLDNKPFPSVMHAYSYLESLGFTIDESEQLLQLHVRNVFTLGPE